MLLNTVDTAWQITLILSRAAWWLMVLKAFVALIYYQNCFCFFEGVNFLHRNSMNGLQFHNLLMACKPLFP